MTTEIATEQKRKMTIKDHLQSPEVIDQIAKALPSHMSADRMARIATTALAKTPKLAECTPTSFFRCLLDLSSWGLEPDGRRAHLIPYGSECTLILDYKGIVELAYRSGWVTKIHCDVVREGDVFRYSLGTVSEHVPFDYRFDIDKPSMAGEIIAAYCIIQLKEGAQKHEVMSRQEINSIRDRSKASRSGPWVTDFSEMAKKTVFRRASKWIPLSSEMHEAYREDGDNFVDSVAVRQPVERKAMPLNLEELRQAVDGE
jgi:recombination protein RecT